MENIKKEQFLLCSMVLCKPSSN